MAGIVDIPKFVDYRNEIQRHPTKEYPVLSLEGKTTIAIHHSLTKRSASGSNADGFARYHVETHGWPSIGYSYVIEPDGTIKFCNDIELRTYHVGDHNNYAVGIVLTGDFRYENPTDEQKQSLRNLVSALQDKYSHLKYIKGHDEFSGYAWKPCPEFDYRAVLNQSGSNKPPEDLPNTYTVQEGDTFYSIAKGLNNLSVDDLKAANPKIDPTALKIGQEIKLGDAKGSASNNSSGGSEWTKVTGDWTGQTLQNGQYGEPVRQLQNELASNNPPFYPNKGASNNGIDGYYGMNTEDAVTRYQKYYGLAVDGLAGQEVYQSLNGSTNSQSASSASGSAGKLKIINVNNSAIVMDRPNRNNSNNLGTVPLGDTLPLNGSVRGTGSNSGYWEVEFEGQLGYITGKYGKQV